MEIKGSPLTLNPDKENISIETPSLSSVSNTADENEESYNAGTIDESMLSEEEKQQVDEFAAEINIEDVEQIVRYGASAQRNISDFSSSVLNKVKTHDLGEVGQSLRELTAALEATVEPEKKGIFGLFQKAKRDVDYVLSNYAKAETNVDRIEKDLQKHQVILTQDISMFQQMYELNLEYYKQLTMYIIAGKKALAAARNGKLIQLAEKAQLTGKQEDVQRYRDYEDMCNRFEKKLSDLEITRMISIQSAPQVRMFQNNDRELLDKLQSSLSNTIPLWRNQLVLSLGIERTKRALSAQAALADKTNDLLKKNAEMLKMATIETAKEVERPIVDIETLRKCNRDLITSITEVVKIHERGTEQRRNAEVELIKIEEELKQALLEAGSR